MRTYTSILAVLLIAGLFSISSCKKDSGGSDEPTPTTGDGIAPIILLNGEDVYEDTLKFSINPELTIPFTIDDDLKTHTLSMSKLEGGIVYYDDLLLNNSEVTLDNVSSGSIRFRALEVGVHSFFLSIKDENELSHTVIIEITVLDNLEPEAAITVDQINEAADYHVQFDASKSFDNDDTWGGTIVAYEFTLVGFYTVETEREIIDYIYPEPGSYSVELRVKDNDEVWSDVVRLDFEVE